MRKARERNLKVLNAISGTILKRNPQHSTEIRGVVKLYEDGKIRNYETAKRQIDNLSSKNPKDRLKAKKDFDKRPTTGRSMG